MNKMAQVFVVLIFIILATLLIGICCAIAFCEEVEEAWVMCQPDSYVNIRAFPKKDAEISGYLLSGDQIYVDGVVKRGFVHIVSANTEAGDGWVSKGYIVRSEPSEDGHVYLIDANGRVAARRTAGGTRRRWMRKGDKVKVYMRSDEWCLTSQGFIKTDYIDLSQRQDVEDSGTDDLTWEED